MNGRGEGQIFAIGGDSDRLSLCYDTRADEWSWLPRLPPGHNISCTVCVNYNDKAIFTFMLDGTGCLKAGVMPLHKLQTSTDPKSITQEMYYALEMSK
jgi:hypothetical protein